MELAFFLACGLLAVGFVLRARIKLLQQLFVPASVLGGLVGLVLVNVPRRDEWIGQAAADQVHAAVDHLHTWPSWLIAVIFAGLLLERPGKSLRDSMRLAAREGIVVWIIILGEVLVGLAATWLVIRRYFDVPGSFGQLIETGFAGGHGTAAAMGDVFKQSLNFPEGRDIGFFFATAGLVFGVVSGIVYVNIAVRRGWTRSGDVEVPLLSGLEARSNPQPVAFGKVRSEVIDPLVFQALILAAAFVAGIGLKYVVMEVIPLLSGLLGAAEHQRVAIVKYAGNMPLFMFTLMGGLAVRELMHLARVGDLVDPDSIRRVVGAAMEFLIVAAIASMKVSVLVKFGWPIALLLVLGFVWTGFCLLFVARRLLPSAYWFELGVLNYGMSTGTTAQGMMLLRIVDKDLNCGAAEDYALAAPLSAPFIGGGVITVILMPYLLQTVPIGLVVLCLALIVVALYFVGLALARTPRSS